MLFWEFRWESIVVDSVGVVVGVGDVVDVGLCWGEVFP